MNAKLKAKTAGPSVGLTLRLTPLAPAAEPCAPDITGLFWFSDASGAFDAQAEAAYLLPEGGAGPILAAAKLVGETCDGEVTWTTSWTPQAPGGHGPVARHDGPDFVAYPADDTAPGILSVSAELDGVTHGPIILILMRYVCYGYGSGGASCSGLTGISWENGSKTASESGSSWSHTGTITGTFPPGTTITWTFVWTGSPTGSLSFSGSGTTCTLTCSGSVGTGNAYCYAKIAAPGCPDAYTDYLYVYVTV